MNAKWRKLGSVILKTTLWVSGGLISILIVMEIILSQSVLTNAVNKYADKYIDGDIHFGKISASMFRRFPSVTLTLEDFSITYPADRFDIQEKAGAQGHLMHSGCGEVSDTLASFRRFSAAINLSALLSGTFHIPYLRLDKPRIFAHSYQDGSANWDIVSSSSGPEKEKAIESGEPSMPKIILGRIRMSGRPHIVYTDSRDTIFTMINIRHLGFNGKVNTKRISRSKVGLTMDTMFIAGRLGRDTIALGIDKIYLHERNKSIDADIKAKAFIAARGIGRMMIPIDINGVMSIPKDTVPGIRTERIDMNIAHIPINAEDDIRFHSDRITVHSNAGIDGCSISKLIDSYAVHFFPETGKIGTDAHIFLSASCNGDYFYESGRLPDLKARLRIPESVVTHSDLPGQQLTMALDISAETDESGKLNAYAEDIRLLATGLDFNGSGQIYNILGADPSVKIDAGIKASIDSLASFLPDTLGISASGSLEGKVNGSAYASQLNLYNFSLSSLTGDLFGTDIDVQMQKDTICATIDGLKIHLGPEEKTSRRGNGKSFRLMGITGEISRADISYKDALKLHTENFRIAAKNAINTQADAPDTIKRISPFGGSIKADKLSLRDSDGAVVSLHNTWNGFQILPKRGSSNIPMLTLTSHNTRIFLKSDINRATFKDADIKVSAVMNTIERRRKLKAMRDSLAKAYPDIPRDSLFRHMIAQKGPRPPLPDWLKEEDFRKQDIDISLDKSIAKYFRDWNLKGGIKVNSGVVMTPYFPLRNRLQEFELNFTNDRIGIDEFHINSGESNISITGELTGLKRALLGRRGSLKLNADISSSKMNADQLLTAYSSGCNFNPTDFKVEDNVSDEEFMKSITIDSTSAAASPLLVIPANIKADISFKASDITYSNLKISKATAGIVMKERCVQLTDTKAITNMGDISLEGFYATRSKKDLKTGFNINFKDITAEKVISLMPSIDTLMPLLKSFGGLLNCELAATARIDTNMNIIMPSINGIIRIGGDNLTISNNDMFRSIAKVLMFRNKKEGRIDKMTVEGVISDNRLEVFPFILEMDRYTLGLSGIQNMDMSFRYHASLIRSPFLIKLGVDLYGSDFENMKFKIGRAKYKNKNVPVFSAIIDQTKINLVESIRHIFDKGVDSVMERDRKGSLIESHKKSIGYIQAVDQKMEELSEEEKKKLEEEQNNTSTDEQSGIH